MFPDSCGLPNKFHTSSREKKPLAHLHSIHYNTTSRGAWLHCVSSPSGAHMGTACQNTLSCPTGEWVPNTYSQCASYTGKGKLRFLAGEARKDEEEEKGKQEEHSVAGWFNTWWRKIREAVEIRTHTCTPEMNRDNGYDLDIYMYNNILQQHPQGVGGTRNLKAWHHHPWRRPVVDESSGRAAISSLSYNGQIACYFSPMFTDNHGRLWQSWLQSREPSTIIVIIQTCKISTTMITGNWMRFPLPWLQSHETLTIMIRNNQVRSHYHNYRE